MRTDGSIFDLEKVTSVLKDNIKLLEHSSEVLHEYNQISKELGIDDLLLDINILSGEFPVDM